MFKEFLDECLSVYDDLMTGLDYTIGFDGIGGGGSSCFEVGFFYSGFTLLGLFFYHNKILTGLMASTNSLKDILFPL